VDREWLYKPLPTASLFHYDYVHTYKGFSGPVGSGKSYAFAYEALNLAYFWNRGLLGLIGAPTYPLLRDATRRTFLEILELEEIPYSFNKNENRITLLDPGSEIIFRSLDNYERLRGPNLAWFGVDELTYCKPAAWSRLEARLRHPKANRLCGFAAWTPKGFDAVYEAFIAKPGSQYKAFLASPRENPYTDATGLYDRLAESYDQKLYQQEVLGEYLNVLSGNAYYAFERARNMQQVEYESSASLAWSLDFNVDPMCSVIAQVVDTTSRADMLSGRRSGVIQVLDELYLRNASTPQACEAFHQKASRFFRGFPIQVNIYGDASGSARQTAGAGAESDWQAVREFFSRHREYTPSYKYSRSNPPVRDRVAAVNGMLRNSLGQSRLFVDPRAKNLIRDLERVVWKEGSPLLDKDSDGMLTHLSDALGYLVETEFGVRPAGGYRPEFIA
jgi:hypothetical protein